MSGTSLNTKLMAAGIIIALAGGLVLGFDYYSSLDVGGGSCTCVTLANQLLGIFYGLVFGAFLLVIAIVIAFIKSVPTIGKILIALLILSIGVAIGLWFIANKIQTCNAGCSSTVSGISAAGIAGWILLDIGILLFVVGLLMPAVISETTPSAGVSETGGKETAKSQSPGDVSMTTYSQTSTATSKTGG